MDGRYIVDKIILIGYTSDMERSELVQYYMRTLHDDEKNAKLLALKQRKKELINRIKALENYIQMVETELESVLDRIDYLNLHHS